MNKRVLESCLDPVERSLSSQGDLGYFNAHKSRYLHCVRSVSSLFEPSIRILDVGSHYLHQASAFESLGHEVHALDVPEFAQLPFVAQRARDFHIVQHECANFSKGDFLPLIPDNHFQVILFCEILEHITFNPIRFWQRIYQLLAPGGIIFLSTPNSLRLVNAISAIKRIIIGEGIGIDVPSIFTTVTYGHHWKEYSKKEIKNYFAILSPDFSVQMASYRYRTAQATRPNFKSTVRSFIQGIGNFTGIGAEEIEAIVRLDKKTSWSAIPKNHGDD